MDHANPITDEWLAVVVPESNSPKHWADVEAQAAAAVAAGVPLAYDSTAGPVVGPKQ